MENDFKEVDLDDLEDDKTNDWTWEKNYNFRDPVVSTNIRFRETGGS